MMHTPHPSRRSVITEIEQRFAAEVAATAGHQFRPPRGHLPALVAAAVLRVSDRARRARRDQVHVRRPGRPGCAVQDDAGAAQPAPRLRSA
jgi:hypothetical protein